LLTLGSFPKIKEVAHMFGARFIHGEGYAIILQKCTYWAIFWTNFFTDSSGHPDHHQAARLCVIFTIEGSSKMTLSFEIQFAILMTDDWIADYPNPYWLIIVKNVLTCGQYICMYCISELTLLLLLVRVKLTNITNIREGLNFFTFFSMKDKLDLNGWGRCYDHNFLRFCQFSAKKLAFFSKTNVMIKILHNLALFWVKNANFFAIFFRRKYF
jgi:hypothetical protein